jgi:hypothetical protein
MMQANTRSNTRVPDRYSIATKLVVDLSGFTVRRSPFPPMSLHTLNFVELRR